MKKVLALILCVALTLSFVACGAAPAPSSSVAESTSAPAAEPANITVVLKLMGTAYWAVLQQGAEQAAKDLGVNVTVVGVSADSEIEQQIALLQNAAASNPDAILIGVTDSAALAKPVKEVVDAGIPVILVDTVVKPELAAGETVEDYFTAALLTDNVAAGEMAARTLIENLKKTHKEDEAGKIAIQVSSMGSQTIADRVAGFKAVWEAEAPKAWEVMWDDIKQNDGKPDLYTQFAQDFLTAYPDLIALFSPNNGSTVGFAKVLVEEKRTDVALVGFDYSPEMAAIIADTNYNVSTMLQRQYFMGYDGIKTALKIINGETVDKRIDTGLMAVSKDNVNSAEVQAIVNPGK